MHFKTGTAIASFLAKQKRRPARLQKRRTGMEIGVFIPIGNNGWLLSENAPQYKPSFELNKAITLKPSRRSMRKTPACARTWPSRASARVAPAGNSILFLTTHGSIVADATRQRPRSALRRIIFCALKFHSAWLPAIIWNGLGNCDTSRRNLKLRVSLLSISMSDRSAMSACGVA